MWEESPAAPHSRAFGCCWTRCSSGHEGSGGHAGWGGRACLAHRGAGPQLLPLWSPRSRHQQEPAAQHLPSRGRPTASLPGFLQRHLHVLPLLFTSQKTSAGPWCDYAGTPPSRMCAHTHTHLPARLQSPLSQVSPRGHPETQLTALEAWPHRGTRFHPGRGPTASQGALPARGADFWSGRLTRSWTGTAICRRAGPAPSCATSAGKTERASEGSFQILFTPPCNLSLHICSIRL